MPDRSALVTGASSGIGEELARGLAARGYNLVLVARRMPELERLAKQLSAAHKVECDVLAADLTERSEVEGVAEQIRKRSITTVVNNAGYGSHGRFYELLLASELNEIELNICALVALSHAVLEVAVPAGSGGLLNVASTASFQPGPTNATYSATKAFVRSFTEALHEEVYKAGVHVTALCPGITKTEFQSRAGMEGKNVPRYMWSDAATVAKVGLEALERNQAVCIPGVVNKATAAGVRLAPRSVARKLAGRVLERM